MWLLRLLSARKPEPVVRVEYVPVTLADARPHDQKWDDEAYLQGVKAFGVNEVYVGEVLHELSIVRELADRAATPDELKGCRAGIDALKRLLTLAPRAGGHLRGMRAMKEGNDASGEQ